MERGDYSIYGWPALGGADLGFHMNQTYNVNTEVGRLVRTKEFRIAFSHAIDREGINETAQLGLGVIQNRIPHPNTPYHPGDDELTQLYMDRDLDKANQMLDDLGLTGRDADGFPHLLERRASKPQLHLRRRTRTGYYRGTAESPSRRSRNRDYP